MQLLQLRNLVRIASASAAMFIAPLAWAQCDYTTLVQQVVASDPTANSSFGGAVAIDGTTFVVGAPGLVAGASGEVGGAVYVFVRSGDFVSQQQKIVPSDVAPGDQFGWSVALQGNTLLVGAPGDDGGRGSAYVFTRSGTTWTQRAKLVASDGVSSDRFGSAVSFGSSSQRTIAVVGAPNDDNSGPTGTTGGADAGAAYVFTLNTIQPGAQWTEVEKIMATDGDGDDRFGASLSASGTTAVIGAYRDTTEAGFLSGSAYVFVGDLIASTWTQQVRLVPDNGANNGYFGYGISYENNTAFIGSYLRDNGSGGFYVFTRSGGVWTQSHYFPSTSSRTFFGGSLSLDGDLAVVGSAMSAGPTSQPRPPVRIYRRNNGAWTFVHEIPTDSGTSGLGSPVAISGNVIAVSAPNFTQTQVNQGTVFFHDLDTGPSTQISSQPSDTSVCLGETATLDVEAVGTQLTYRWQRDLGLGVVNLGDGPVGSSATISGATTPSLNLTFTAGQSWVVRCRLTTACGVLDTDWITVTARDADDPLCTGSPVCPECAADYDQDGGVTGSDIGTFFVDFESGAACADVDLDGGITGADLGYFFQVFEAGGC